jgi:EAL domain-containing protein (putative c-di-GMP-specific phosphodiesterase class I)
MQITEVTESFSLDSVVPYFQPIMDLNNNAVWRYECLARLVTFNEHSYLPSEFLFLVERQQSVALLTETIFSRSARYFRDINMAWNINVSLADMTDPQIHAFLGSQLQDYPNPERVALEITASNALNDLTAFSYFASICTDLGISLFVDHFSEKSADIQTILALPVSGIKVSANSVNDNKGNGQSLDFISRLNEQAKKQGVILIAEHIENEQELAVVKEIGINYAQGFYFSQPKAQTD